MAPLLLTVKTYTKCTIVYRSPGKQIVQSVQNSKMLRSTRKRKPETYSQNQQPSKADYGRYYVPTDSMYKHTININ